MSIELKVIDESLRLDQNYRNFLKNAKERLRSAQIRATLASNVEQIRFNWQTGMDIIKHQEKYKWGERFLDQFSHDMRQDFPGMTGFSIRNLQRMRQFARCYPDFSITTQVVSQLPWSQIIRLIQMVKDVEIREWYAQESLKNGWSREILETQIETGLYERQGIPGKKLSNFNANLPPAQSALANELLKDPYNFDFLTIQGKAHERAIEDALVTHVRDFLLELGQGFAFVGSQVPLTFDDQEFFIDLLFYHLNLRCFVVIELLCGAPHKRSYVAKPVMCC